MPVHVIAIAVDCADAEALAAFWREALGYPEPHRWSDADGRRYVQLDGDPPLLFQPVPEGKTGKNRLHLDVAPAEGDQYAEVDRLAGLGATVLSDESRHPWVVLADPEGNEFCVLPAR
ncbi:VOC family protein [Prauserella cavernicola]|uniref:VOC family protein n=1 Tax=Prauserella cavernicola TaxID=2800127 RepID=A0A934V241_9PSEU|nr:VOC family protein [Prauserella cavernicola]MBK1784706.1 VOC family protein [Prauserella cavernicola]